MAENIKTGPTFHAWLGRLYGSMLELNRKALWGDDALLTLYESDLFGVQVEKYFIRKGWLAERDTVIAPGVEVWRLEISTFNETFDQLADIVACDITGHGLPQRFKVMQAVRPELPGHIWMFQLIPTGELQ